MRRSALVLNEGDSSTILGDGSLLPNACHVRSTGGFRLRRYLSGPLHRRAGPADFGHAGCVNRHGLLHHPSCLIVRVCFFVVLAGSSTFLDCKKCPGGSASPRKGEERRTIIRTCMLGCILLGWVCCGMQVARVPAAPRVQGPIHLASFCVLAGHSTNSAGTDRCVHVLQL